MLFTSSVKPFGVSNTLQIKVSLAIANVLTIFTLPYSCFEKGCPTEKHQSVRDNTERHDGLWLFTGIVKFTSLQRVGRRCYEYLFVCVKRNKMDSEL